MGRITIWRVCLEMVQDHPIFGFGIGGFSRKYMNYQARYLSQTSPDISHWLADDIFCPYNEILHLLITFGIPISIGMVFLILFIIRHGIENKNPFSLHLIYLSVFSLFSFPSYHYITIVLFLFSALLILRKGELKYQKAIILSIVFGIFVVSAYFSLQQFVLRESEKSFAYGKPLDDLMMKMVENSPFLLDYYVNTAYEHGFELSDDLINRAVRYIPSSRIMVIAADRDIERNEYNKAEDKLKVAVKMVPSRIWARSKLFDLYNKQGRVKEAMEIGDEILKMPLKVEGEAYIIQNKIKRQMQMMTPQL